MQHEVHTNWQDDDAPSLHAGMYILSSSVGVQIVELSQIYHVYKLAAR